MNSSNVLTNNWTTRQPEMHQGSVDVPLSRSLTSVRTQRAFHSVDCIRLYLQHWKLKQKNLNIYISLLK